MKDDENPSESDVGYRSDNNSGEDEDGEESESESDFDIDSDSSSVSFGKMTPAKSPRGSVPFGDVHDEIEGCEHVDHNDPAQVGPIPSKLTEVPQNAMSMLTRVYAFVATFGSALLFSSHFFDLISYTRNGLSLLCWTIDFPVLLFVS